MIRLLRQYPATALSGAIAAAGAGGCALTYLLDWRDQSRNRAADHLKNKVKEIKLSDDLDALRKTAQELQKFSGADYDWRHLRSWASYDGWLSSWTINATAHELEQAAKELDEGIEKQIKQVLDEATKKRLSLATDRAYTCTDQDTVAAVTAYAAQFGPQPVFEASPERLQHAIQAARDLHTPQIQERDPKWAQQLLAFGLVCLATALTRDLIEFRRLPIGSARTR